jgi:hypothetical protein
VLSPPIEIEAFDVHVAWHRRRDNDPALGWLRTGSPQRVERCRPRESAKASKGSGLAVDRV